ncbi:hypothetical protein [Methylobacterium longum]|uniref:DUF1311 domain-containing protein n=1 Tax=Methylobacterium longum TaxID=767694 RepID=A0ABT8AR55_9HYPH|nr:hypothetical protein [Methylobacterium longum]MDN3572387.1 hypothetical protein [Methylobacterium longum]GJE09471.1 hypothetical protein FOHLNKBM_0495 [Methylobacterium longum]
MAFKDAFEIDGARMIFEGAADAFAYLRYGANVVRVITETETTPVADPGFLLSFNLSLKPSSSARRVAPWRGPECEKGRSVSDESGRQIMGVVVLLGLAVMGVSRCTGGSETSAAKTGQVQAVASAEDQEKIRLAAVERAERDRRIDASCREDLECTAREGAFSTVMSDCRRAIEKGSENVVEWTDGVFGDKFPQSRWRDKQKGHVEYRGDSAKMQNDYGTWKNLIYTCVVDVPNKKVLDYTVRTGRI